MEKIIYKNKKIEFTGQLNFKDKILFDRTDHFCFACNNCESHLDIYKVNIINQTLFFLTKCPNCKLQNARKIYLDSKTNNLVFGLKPTNK